MKFRWQVLGRTFLIIGFAFGAFYFWNYTPFSLMVFWMILFSILSLVELIRFVERSNRDLRNFLIGIKQNDFSTIYPQKESQKNHLYHAFNLITREFIKLRSEKESNYHFFKTVVEHSRVPLIAYTLEEQQVTLVNEAAKELFGIPYISKLSSLKNVDEQLYNSVVDLQSEKKILLKVQVKNDPITLSIVSKVLVLQENTYKVLAFYNLNSELDQQEVESWQKLIRVLTHEIKNSVIPISTLSEVVNQMITEQDGSEKAIEELDEEDQDDLRISLRTIEKRSKGLVKFVNSYGDLARTPKLELEEVDVIKLVQQVLDLESEELRKRDIRLETSFPNRPVSTMVDTSAIDQILINISKNAIEAMEGGGDSLLNVSVLEAEGFAKISIEDNGPGIDDETLSNIFIPFYTTKEGGSGIGLPLSKQLIRAHGGNIQVKSTVGSGTRFEISIPIRNK